MAIEVANRALAFAREAGDNVAEDSACHESMCITKKNIIRELESLAEPMTQVALQVAQTEAPR
eukprot:7046587-Heterocapsa_arctica.AAC.1